MNKVSIQLNFKHILSSLFISKQYVGKTEFSFDEDPHVIGDCIKVVSSQLLILLTYALLKF